MENQKTQKNIPSAVIKHVRQLERLLSWGNMVGWEIRCKKSKKTCRNMGKHGKSRITMEGFFPRKTSINDATASHDETGFISKSLSPHRMSSGASHRLGVVAPATEYMLQITTNKNAWSRSLTLAKKVFGMWKFSQKISWSATDQC